MITVALIPVLKDNYTFCITTQDNTFIIVDPGDAAPVIKYLEQNNLKPSYILNTHHHGDHVAGNLELKAKYNTHIIAPSKEADKIPAVDQKVSAGDILHLGSEDIHIMAAEGHTAGGVMYYFKDCAKIFVGDTLFSMGCGRLFEGTAAQMFDALASIKTLPDKTEIYCGHEYTLTNAVFCLSIDPENKALQTRITDVKSLRDKNLPTIPTTIGLEKQTNVFLKTKNVEEFSALRRLKDTF